MSKNADQTDQAVAGRGLWGWLKLAMASAMLVLGALMLLPPGWFGMTSIGPQALQVQLAGANPPVVVDVRTSPEYASGHIAGAIPAPLHVLPFTDLGIDPDRDVVLICLSGHRSRVAGFFLKIAGFDHIINLTGGMAAWRGTGLPVAK